VSKHNLKYWSGGEYLGFGPDASSDFGGQRFSCVRDVHAYIDGIFTDGQVMREIQEIPHRERAGEYLMMRLRTTGGIRPEEYEKQFLLPFAPLEEVLEKYHSQFYTVKTRDNRWHLTPKGFLISNTILSDLLLVQEQTTPLRRR
jgi:oxygen-independent coproporphyrinogen-3 oxidase